MQAAKDSFYVTLRDRLAQAYPARTITVGAVTRPAVVVTENDKPSVGVRQNDAFYLEWGEARMVRPAISRLMGMTCTVWFASAGTGQNGGLDRGRRMGELDAELVAIGVPASARKCDYSEAAPVDLGSNIFWSAPVIRPAKAAPNAVGSEASLTVYFYPEVLE